MVYSYIEIATVLASSMRTIPSQASRLPQVRSVTSLKTQILHSALPGTSPQTIAYIMGRLRVGHSCRTDTSSTHRLP